MSRTTPILNTFTAGELSPLLDGRIDVASYFTGARVMQNFLPMPYGGAQRRPGTYYVASTKGDAAGRLVSFQFSTTQAYILEFTDLALRFYKDNGQIESAPSTPYEIVTPYLAAELRDLQFAQSADTMWIVHPSHKPMKLTRSGHTAWTLGNYTPTADPFTGAGDYPSCVAIYEQRIIFANTDNDPQKVFSTKSGDYENMTVGADDDDAFAYTIGSDQVNAIRWLSAGKVLLMGTLGGLFSLSGGTGTEAVTPTNVVVKKETSYGSYPIPPKRIGNFAYYVQRNKKILREVGYTYELDEYLANDITTLSEHITDTGIVEMDYQQAPYNILWCVREDGQICTLTRQVDQKVTGWARQVTDGFFESVAVIPGDGDDDQVWFIVKRVINGVTKRYVEYLKPFDWGEEQEDVFFVDCGLTLDNPITITGATQAMPVVITASAHGLTNGDDITIRGVVGMTELNKGKFIIANKTDDTFELRDLDNDEIDGSLYGEYESGGEARELVGVISGLDHLEAKTVSVCGDGAAVPDEVVSAAGEITIDTDCGEVHVGLAMPAILQTMRLESGGDMGTAQGKMKRINKVCVRVHESLGCAIGTPTQQDDVSFRNSDDSTDEAIPLYTGDKFIAFPSSYNTDAYVYVIQEQPLPLHILALIIFCATNEY